MAGGLLGRHLYFRSRDVDETRDKVARVYCDHALTLVGDKALNAYQYHARLGALSLSYIQYGARVQIDPGELESFFLIQMPLTGSAELRSGNKTIHSSPGLASIADPTRRLIMEWSADCLKLNLRIDRSAVNKYFSDVMMDGLPSGGIVFDPLLDLTKGHGRHWAGLMGLLESYLSQVDEGERSPLVAKSYEDLILSFLLAHQPNNMSDRLHRPTAPQILPRHVKRAEEYMRAHAGEDLTMADITREVGVSLRCLQEGFRRFRAMTPREALQQIRLDGVRADLLGGGGAASVTQVALKWGFSHFGRFSQCYRNRFCELPSETLRGASRKA